MINANSDKKKEKMIKKGSRLKECRIEKGLSQADLAEILNCSNNHISMIERGERNLTYENAEILSKHLGILTDYLMDNALYKTKEEESEDLLDRISWLDNSFRKYLLSSMDVFIWFHDIDDIETLNFLNSQDIIFQEYGSSSDCLVRFKDGTTKLYEIDAIQISDPMGSTITHTINKDTYMELQEDIENYIHYKIENLSVVNTRKRNTLKNSRALSEFYKKYDELAPEKMWNDTE